MESSYKKLIYESGLYPLKFIREYGENGSHWFGSSWHQRELSLRHDMVCVLLCNMETYEETTQKRAASPIPGPSNKKQRKSETETSSSSGHTIDCLPEEDFDDFDIYVPDEEVPLEVEEERADPEQDLYRLVCLEGMSSAPMLQNKFCQRWGIEPYPTLFDIIDKKERKLIEVKVGLRYAEEEMRYLDKSNNRRNNTAFFYVNPQTIEKVWVDHPGKLVGEDKVSRFLIKRRCISDEYRMMETDLAEEEEVERVVFNNDRFNNLVKIWYEPFWERREMEPPINLTTEPEKSPSMITPKDMLDHLVRVEERQAPPIKWRGKLLSPIWNRFETTQLSKDTDIVRDLIKRWKLSDIQPNSPLQRIIKKWSDHFSTSDCTSFDAYPVKKMMQDEEFQSCLGIGHKKYHRDDSCETTRQPEPKPMTEACYHPWFDTLLFDMSDNHTLIGKPFRNLGGVTPTEHPIAISAQRAFNSVVSIFKESWSGIYASKITNYGSRIGGAYLSSRSKSSHNNVVTFPIYATLEDQGETTRATTGLVIRGPHHAHQATDKIGLITIEMIEPTDKNLEYSKFIHSCEIFDTPSGYKLVAKINSDTKHNCTYSAFSINSLFVISNLIGEVILNDPKNPTNMNIIHEVKLFCDRNRRWISSRMVEALMMITIGTGQEEGFFAMLRKLYMCMLAWKRKEPVALWPVEDFCGAVNENLINSPIAMHYSRSAIEVLKILSESFH
ncbi:replicase PA [Halyomorpha halys orthomyxo-like virus 1]|nr:replicase PA [Halyomorpha halys orthomyxo-like virus 1]WJE88690.1 MAG: polymerase [Halyomorpha halys orthomyxo-like virus 1]